MGMLMFKVGITLLKITAVMFIVGTLAFRVTVLGFSVRRLPSIIRILRSVIGPEEYRARVLLLVIGQGRHADLPGWKSCSSLNFEGQGQDTSVVFTIGLLAGVQNLRVWSRNAYPRLIVLWLSSLLCVVNASSSPRLAAVPDQTQTTKGLQTSI